ncbi:Gfo/Idh/MocA family protein [Evansella sp. AB-rgal1]|uniref:Gfo/Idh/MocA family protein n=1 Tax=Evansella sp. AB-rgal1 TaxID=3242696 RepID=UPI00359DDD70
MIKWGILSSANIAAKAIVPALQKAENAELVAVASESGKAQKTAEEWGAAKFYNSYLELLNDPDIDAVYIPLPNSLHKEWVIETAKHKKHVLVEKPAGITAEEVKEMIQGCEENNVFFMEAFMYQFHPQHDRVKEIMKSGEIGEIKLIRSTFSFPIDLESNNIRLNAKLGGGSLFDVGCYCVHVSRLLLEREPEQVYLNSNVDPKLGVDLTSTGVLHFGSVLATIDCSFEQPRSNRYEVVGTKGSIEVPFAFRPDAKPDSSDGFLLIKNDHSEVVREERVEGDQYKIQMEHFSSCILEKKSPSYTGEQTYHNLKVIESLYASMETNAPIKL